MSAAAQEHPVDEARLEQFLGRLITDMGAAANAVLVMIGDELGIWRALDGAGPLTAEALSERTGLRERYLREWLAAQAASGYVTYDPADDTFTLPTEQALVFCREDSPFYIAGGFHVIGSIFRDRDKLTERLRTGDGFGWQP